MGSGRRKIEIKRVEKEGQRMVTFSKRRRGLFNKARQLRCLTGADIAILTFSPAGRPYTHGEPSFDALPVGRPYTHGKPSFDALVDRYLNTAAAGEKAEEGCEAAAANHHRLSSWLDALQFDASDSIEDLEILKKGLEEIAAKVVEKIDDLKRECPNINTAKCNFTLFYLLLSKPNTTKIKKVDKMNSTIGTRTRVNLSYHRHALEYHFSLGTIWDGGQIGGPAIGRQFHDAEQRHTTTKDQVINTT
ncbi:Agamous-like MADS-box protein AGL28, partial [Camellia lanceoleosa]